MLGFLLYVGCRISLFLRLLTCAGWFIITSTFSFIVSSLSLISSIGVRRGLDFGALFCRWTAFSMYLSNLSTYTIAAWRSLKEIWAYFLSLLLNHLAHFTISSFDSLTILANSSWLCIFANIGSNTLSMSYLLASRS